MTELKPVSNWKAVLQKAWSIKFSIAAAVFAMVEVVLALLDDGTAVPRGTFAGLAALASTGGTVARVLAQKEMANKA